MCLRWFCLINLVLLGFCAENRGLAALGKLKEIKDKLANKTNEEKAEILAKVIDDNKDYIESAINKTVVTISKYDEIIPSRYLDDINRIINHLDFDEPAPRAVSRDEVRYFLFARDQRDVEMSENDTSALENRNYRHYVFLIHGWRSDRNNYWMRNLTDAILNVSDVAAIQVDWSSAAADLYALTVLNTREVGIIIGDFIIRLSRERDVDLDKVTLIGHSLGAHVSGYISKHIQKVLDRKVARIYGLDPAGPLFTRKEESDRLSKDDAKIVVILHTDGGKFGFKPSFGAADFYANTGTAVQPGCLDLDNISIENITSAVFCSHSRAPVYMIEAIQELKNIVGLRCDSFDVFSSGGCDENRAYEMLYVDLGVRGDFYFSTNDVPPFIKRGAPLEGGPQGRDIF